MKKLTIIIPALNEEQAIVRVLKSIPSAELKKMGYQPEVMVIDNGSTDKTKLLAIRNGAKVIVQPVRGYGNAYKAGFSNADTDIIVTGDADLTYPFEEIPRFLRLMKKEKLDFINTDRLSNVKKESMHWTHQFGNWFLTKICRVLWWGFPFKDSQSGMWIFKQPVWEKLNVMSTLPPGQFPYGL